MTYSVFTTRDVEEESLDQRIEVLCHLDEAHHRALAAEPVRKKANGTYDIEADREGHRDLR